MILHILVHARISKIIYTTMIGLSLGAYRTAGGNASIEDLADQCENDYDEKLVLKATIN